MFAIALLITQPCHGRKFKRISSNPWVVIIPYIIWECFKNIELQHCHQIKQRYGEMKLVTAFRGHKLCINLA